MNKGEMVSLNDFPIIALGNHLISSERALVEFRNKIMSLSISTGFSEVESTRLATAVSEFLSECLANNRIPKVQVSFERFQGSYGLSLGFRCSSEMMLMNCLGQIWDQQELTRDKMNENLLKIFKACPQKVFSPSWEFITIERAKLNKRNRDELLEDLRESKEMAETASHAKSLFLANMSHEIRTPMNAILGYAQILDRNQNIDTNAKKQINSMMIAGNHLLSLINDILDLSKIESGKMELDQHDFDLSETIKEIKNMMKERFVQKHLNLEVNLFTEKPVYVEGDEKKIRQSLINLMGNALKFTDKGKVCMSLENPSADMYLFRILDTGCGIAGEALAEVFNTFSQSKAGRIKGGTGLGLAITQRQVELMGGKLNVKSKLGKGSEFSFQIKLNKSQNYISEIYKKRKISRLQGNKKITILLATVDPQSEEIFEKLLQPIGIDILTTRSWEYLLDQLKNNSIDLLVMDGGFHGLSGIQGIQLVRKYFPKKALPIIYFSASVLEENVESAFKAGCDAFFGKPFEVDMFLVKLGEVLNLEYTYIEKEDLIPTLDDIEITELEFPPGWIPNMMEKAESGNLDDLEIGLERLPTENEECSKLKLLFAEHIYEADIEMLINLLSYLKGTVPDVKSL